MECRWSKQSLIESQADLLIIPAVIIDNYDDFDILSDVLNSYVSNGGGVLFPQTNHFMVIYLMETGDHILRALPYQKNITIACTQLWRELRDQLTLVFYTQRI